MPKWLEAIFDLLRLNWKAFVKWHTDRKKLRQLMTAPSPDQLAVLSQFDLDHYVFTVLNKYDLVVMELVRNGAIVQAGPATPPEMTAPFELTDGARKYLLKRRAKT